MPTHLLEGMTQITLYPLSTTTFQETHLVPAPFNRVSHVVHPKRLDLRDQAVPSNCAWAGGENEARREAKVLLTPQN